MTIELDAPATKEALKQKLNSLLIHPLSFPEVCIWYFQKIIDKKSKLPFALRCPFVIQHPC